MSANNLIELHHFGEVLVELIIENLGQHGFEKFLSAKGFYPGQGKLGLSTLPFKMKNLKASSFAKLTSNEGYGFDSESDIDVGVFYRNADKYSCFPIEVKMGKKQPVESWVQFCRYMVAKNPVSLQKKKTTLNGCMPSLMSHTLKSTEAGNSYGFRAFKGHPGPIEADFEAWGLCIRSDLNKFLKEIKHPSTIERMKSIKTKPIIFHFDHLKEFAIDEGIPLQKLVGEMLDTSVKETLSLLFPAKNII